MYGSNSGLTLPKQARYQLRYTRLWNCFICGLTCGLGRLLTIGFAEMVPASGSVPAGCGIVPFPSWMGGICSQSKRATNCATPGYKIFQLWSNMWSTLIFDQLPARGKVLPSLLSQGFPGFPGTAARTYASRSQITCATNCATPGYSVFLHDTMQRRKKQVFRVCGQRCGQV